MFYLRLYAHGKKPNNGGYEEKLLSTQDVFQRIKHHDKFDVIDMETWQVLRHDYKKPLPNWLGDDLLRKMVLNTGQIPNQNP